MMKALEMLRGQLWEHQLGNEDLTYARSCLPPGLPLQDGLESLLYNTLLPLACVVTAVKLVHLLHYAMPLSF